MTLMDQIVQELTLVNVLIALAVTVVGIPLAVWGYDTYRFRQLPPGPPTRPFIGNKHLIPASRPWLKMAEWSETYVNSLPPAFVSQFTHPGVVLGFIWDSQIYV